MSIRSNEAVSSTVQMAAVPMGFHQEITPIVYDPWTQFSPRVRARFILSEREKAAKRQKQEHNIYFVS